MHDGCIIFKRSRTGIISYCLLRNKTYDLNRSVTARNWILIVDSITIYTKAHVHIIHFSYFIFVSGKAYMGSSRKALKYEFEAARESHYETNLKTNQSLIRSNNDHSTSQNNTLNRYPHIQKILIACLEFLT